MKEIDFTMSGEYKSLLNDMELLYHSQCSCEECDEDEDEDDCGDCDGNCGDCECDNEECEKNHSSFDENSTDELFENLKKSMNDNFKE